MNLFIIVLTILLWVSSYYLLTWSYIYQRYYSTKLRETCGDHFLFKTLSLPFVSQ